MRGENFLTKRDKDVVLKTCHIPGGCRDIIEGFVKEGLFLCFSEFVRMAVLDLIAKIDGVKQSRSQKWMDELEAKLK